MYTPLPDERTGIKGLGSDMARTFHGVIIPMVLQISGTIVLQKVVAV